MESPREKEIDPDAPGLAPRDPDGWLYTLLTLAVSAAGLALSWDHGWRWSWAAWLGGQLLVATAFVQWFGILHECGHRTFFRSRAVNLLVGQVAGFFALIPYACWQRVHWLHHRWTGWQDLDPTTEGLAKEHGRFERLLANFCWRCWIPLFSVIYRLANYWHLPRLRRFLPRGAFAPMVANAAALLLLYAALGWVLGPLQLLRLVGLGLLLGLIFQDIFLLGQHTHVPQNLARGAKVDPIPFREQEVFTRSVLFPPLFSRFVLFGADEHELHHMFPSIPGYHLRELGCATENGIDWWRFTLAARRLPGEVFLFQNRRQTGLSL